MLKHILAVSALLLVGMLLVACGQVEPSASGPGAAGPDTTATAGAVAATGGGPSWALVPTPTTDTTSPVALAMKAAIDYAKSAMHATHPTVAEAGQGLFDPADPNSTVWVVRLVSDTFQLPDCPPGTPQTTYARTCGSGGQARLGLRISDLAVVDAEVYSTPGTPIANTPIQLPPNAKLPTRAAAIDAIFHPGGDTHALSAHLVSADLVLAGHEPMLGDVAPDTPIWRIVLDHGSFDHSCPAVPPGVPKPSCSSTAITIWIDAITGNWHAASYGPPGTPTP